MLQSHNSSNEYCMYLRKSRADQEAELHGDGETLARHESILLQLAKKYGITITRIYREIVSGETIESRPEVQAMLSDVSRGLYAGVFVVEIERLARGDTMDQGIIAKAFKYSDTLIITPIKVFDPTNEFDEEYFEFGLFMSRREYKMINRRIQRGRIASVKDGKYISPTAPFGYERYKIESDKGYSLRPHPKEAEAVRTIFDLYVNGMVNASGKHETMGSWKLAIYLEEHGIKPRTSSAWSPSSVREILKNPVYTGKICWGRRKEIKQIIDGKTVISRPDSVQYIQSNGIHEALVSIELFEKAQKIMSSHKNRPVNKSRVLKNPLSGLIYCQKCGSLMTRLGPNKKNTYSTIKCPNRICDNVSAPMYLVEKVLIQSISEWLEEYRIQIERREYTQLDREEQLLLSSLDAVEKEIQELQKQQTKTYELLEREIYTTEIFMQRNKTLNDQIAAATVKKNELAGQYGTVHTQNMGRTQVIPLVTSMLNSYWDTESAAERNDLLKTVLTKVTYLKTERNSRTQVNNTNFTIQIEPLFPDISHLTQTE